jgi:hypothetical protein
VAASVALLPMLFKASFKLLLILLLFSIIL